MTGKPITLIWTFPPQRKDIAIEKKFKTKEGYLGVIRRNLHLGFYCGYVGITPKHKWFKKEYRGEVEDKINVHGGVTFCNFMKDDFKEKYWFIGFDCGHAGDFMTYPSRRNSLNAGEHYWTIEEVEKEIRKMSKQIKRHEK